MAERKTKKNEIWKQLYNKRPFKKKKEKQQQQGQGIPVKIICKDVMGGSGF